MLLQGNVLPQQLYLAKEPLPSSNTLPAAPVQHAHEMTFEEPENRAQPRQRTWRLNKAAHEDEDLMARGEPPRKRLTKEKYHYTCKKCGLDKNKKTGHTQLKGRGYCLESGQTLDDWRKSQGVGWSESKPPVIETSVVHVSEPPTETVTLQPDGTIQHALGDPQYAPLPELTAADLEGLDDLPSWTSSLLEQIDFTPAHWIDPPATSVGGTTSAEPVNHQPAAPASGSLHIVQDPIHDPPCIRKHLDVEAAVRVNTLAIERVSALEGPKAAKIARKIWLIESTGRDTVRAYQAMGAEMTVMNDALDKLTMNR
ncbi:unnamed protein product [Gadus morhua 'NCC']